MIRRVCVSAFWKSAKATLWSAAICSGFPQAVEHWYPQFTLVLTKAGRPYWSGTIKPFRSRLDLFRLALVYRDHVAGIPQIWVVHAEVSRRAHPLHPHLNADGSVCAFFVPDLTYDPRQHDISLLVDLAGDWLRKHVFFEDCGWWPGPVAPHDPSGVLAELKAQPAKPCVCGSGIRFDLCCQRRYQHLASLIAAGRVTSTDAAMGDHAHRVTLLARAIRHRLGPCRAAELLPHAGPPVHLLPFDGK